VDDSHCAEVISGYMALNSALIRATNWSALSAGAACAAGAAVSVAASFLQAASDSTPALTARANSR